ncbi:MAG TPA: DUF2946 family protein [Burkholderiales bacterium]|jgi:hypothetical protein|nr:DUF2946 family protein [Burkholderiales bacterium]
MTSRRFAAWAAILAMALQALWPLIAQAKPRSVTLVPVCTVAGVTHYYEVRAGDSPLEQRTASNHEHCAYCSLDGGRLVVLPSFAHFLQQQQSTGEAVAEPVFSSSASLLFSSARPRAPPGQS